MKLISHINIILFLLLSILITACTKDELPEIPNENNPVFNVTGTIGGASIDLRAGESNVYMHTDTESWNNVGVSSGTLSNGNELFSMSLLKSNIDIPALASNFVELSAYPIADKPEGDYLLRITSKDFKFNYAIESILWKVDDEIQPSQELIIKEPGVYKVCAQVNFISGTSHTTCNSIIVGFKKNAEFQLKWEILENNVIQGYIETLDNSISSIRWYLNNKFISDSHKYKNTGTSNGFLLKAEVTFDNGVIAEREVYINRFGRNLSIEDYTNKQLDTKLSWDNNVRFKFEKDGVIYESTQNNYKDAKFVVNSISNYESKETTHQVKKIKGTLNVPFLNTSTGETEDSDLQIEIGVGY